MNNQYFDPFNIKQENKNSSCIKYCFGFHSCEYYSSLTSYVKKKKKKKKTLPWQYFLTVFVDEVNITIVISMV